MYKIRYSWEFIVKLKIFINNYKNSYIKLIKWWGLDFEDKMISNYIIIWDKLYDDIINSIVNKLEKDIILWVNIKKYVIIKINSFRLFVYFKEDFKKKERIITDVEFYRK